MALVPVDFSQVDVTVLEPDPREALALAPVPPPVASAKPFDLSDARTRGEGLHLGRLVEELELHRSLPNGEWSFVELGQEEAERIVRCARARV